VGLGGLKGYGGIGSLKEQIGQREVTGRNRSLPIPKLIEELSQNEDKFEL